MSRARARRLLLRGGLAALATTATVEATSSCAALVDLDESAFTYDAGARAADATTDGAAGGDGAADAPSDASSVGDALPADDGDSADLPPFWSLDPSFGDGGVLLLAGQAAETLPIISVDGDGVLRVAFADDTPDAQVIVCTRPTEQDASCAPIAVMGYPVDAVSNMTTTVIVTNETLSGEGGIAATDLSGQSTYRSAAGCAAVRAIGLSDIAELQVLGYCGDPVIPVIESFLADDGTTFAGSSISAPANQTGILSLSVEDTTGALWLAGCFGCTDMATSATFFETNSLGSVLGGGEIGASTDFLVATDVYALTPGALVVGLYLSKQEGFFSTIVPPGDDGGAPLNVTYSPLSTGALVVEPSGHTRLAVSSTTGLPKVIVGALHGQPALALSSLGGDGLPVPDTQALQTVPLASLARASVFVGGAIITSGALYVAVRADLDTGSVAALARLAPRQP